MSSSFFDPLTKLNGVRMNAGANLDKLQNYEHTHIFKFPLDHKAALGESNGAQVYGGYLTLFGVDTDISPNFVTWNDPNCWKFAWGSRCLDYWCFAETAWGDQYAYNIPALISGEAHVYLLDCLSMTPTLVACDFTDFLQKEFIPSAREPYDSMIRKARQVLGEIDFGQHLIYTPSPLLGGDEDISNVITMDARAAMIFNGDLASQLDAGPAFGKVNGINPYKDDKGRDRIELTWELPT
jgi:hypothetical protein